MSDDDLIAVDGVRYPAHDGGEDYLFSWHPPEPVPDGNPHGSSAICFSDAGEIVVGRSTAGNWEFPGGRPDPGESWRETLDREVMEEACARVQSATLLGFVRGECLTGPKAGWVLVRSLWAARVELLPWMPNHEITDRKLVDLDEAITLVDDRFGRRPILNRWMSEAVAAARH